MKYRYDLIVVGAGPAGASAARQASLTGLSVLLLEKEKLPRYKACGGGLPFHLHTHLDIDIAKTVHCVARKVVFSYCQRLAFPIKPKHLEVEMVMRDEFDAFLTEMARQAGTTVRDGERFLNVEETTEAVAVETDKGHYISPFLVGADGASSRVAKSAGIKTSFDYGSALSFEMKLPAKAMQKVEETVYFDVGSIPMGYSWIFPKKSQVSIGVCTAHHGYKGLNKDIMQMIRSSMLLREGEIILKKGAPLPFFKQWHSFTTKRVALVGDAAGFVDPLSGEGIHYAIQSGVGVGKIIPELIDKKMTMMCYQAAMEELLRENLEKAKILSAVFFAFPLFVFLIGMLNPFVRPLFVDLVQGKLHYSELFDTLDKSLWAKLFRGVRKVLFPRATAEYFLYQR